MACLGMLLAGIYCSLVLIPAASALLRDGLDGYQREPSGLGDQFAAGQLLEDHMESQAEDTLYRHIETDKRDGHFREIYPFHRPSCYGLWERCHPLFPHLTHCDGTCRPGYSIKACRRIRDQGFKCIQMRQR